MLLSFSATKAQKQFGKILLSSGEEILMYDGSNIENAKKKIWKKANHQTNAVIGFLTINGTKIHYFNESGEIYNIGIGGIKHVKISANDFEDIQFTTNAIKTNLSVIAPEMTLLPLPTKRGIRMQQLVAENDSYILSSLNSSGFNTFYIYDKELNIVEKNISHSLTKGKSTKAIKIVKEYFSDCEELISGMEKNMSNKYGKGIVAQYHLLMTIDKETNKATNFITDIKCN